MNELIFIVLLTRCLELISQESVADLLSAAPKKLILDAGFDSAAKDLLHQLTASSAQAAMGIILTAMRTPLNGALTAF